MAENSNPLDPNFVPDGLMRVWDPDQKKVIFVQAPPAPDRLTLTVRLHDPKEKKNAKLAAAWASVQIPREDIDLSPADFVAKYMPALVEQLEHFKKPTT